MRTIPLALAALLATVPAFAQSYEPHRSSDGGQFSNPAARAGEHQAGHAAQNAGRNAEHARRDAAVGDYQGAADADRRARAEVRDAQDHAHDARHERGRNGGGHQYPR